MLATSPSDVPDEGVMRGANPPPPRSCRCSTTGISQALIIWDFLFSLPPHLKVLCLFFQLICNDNLYPTSFTESTYASQGEGPKFLQGATNTEFSDSFWSRTRIESLSVPPQNLQNILCLLCLSISNLDLVMSPLVDNHLLILGFKKL